MPFLSDEAVERADFEALVGIRGRFIVSLNDTAEVREIFGAFAIEGVETSCSVGGLGKGTRAREVIISPRG